MSWKRPVTKKKSIAVVLTLVVAVAVSGYWAENALVDNDGDGILNFRDPNPTLHNFPVTAYAKEKIDSEKKFSKTRPFIDWWVFY
jgi:hypothetical protein